MNLLCNSEKRLSVSVSLSQVKAEHLIHPVTTRGGSIELHELGGLQVPVDVMVRVRHREGLHTHSGRIRDTLRDLNFELGVHVVMVLFGTVDDYVLVMMAVLHLQ